MSEHNHLLLSFRITHKRFGLEERVVREELINYYIINIKEYLKKKLYVIVEYTAGIHTEAETPHIHIHYLIDPQGKRVPKVFIQDWKYNFQNGKIPISLPNPKPHLPYPCLFSTLHKKKINVCIKSTLLSPDENYERFLAYPFKEGNIFSSTLSDEITTRLQAQAQGEWNAVKIKKLKDKQRKEQMENEYGKICDIIAQAKPSTYTDALRIVLEEVKRSRVEFRDHINPRNIVSSVQKYCFHTGIWSIDEILEKFA